MIVTFRIHQDTTADPRIALVDFLASLSGDDWPDGIPATIDFEDGRGPLHVNITAPGAILAFAGWTDDAVDRTRRVTAFPAPQDVANAP